MAGRVEAQLEEMGIQLPVPVAPLAEYTPYVQTGNLLFVSGQLPIANGELITGQLSAEDHASQGITAPGSKLGMAVGAATLSAVNLLAQVKAATGDLDRVKRVVKLTGFVNCDGTFEQQPTVINGASTLMAGAFGDIGVHARSAVGCSSLPLGAVVEVEGIFEIE